MFCLMFPPVATGWLSTPLETVDPDSPTRRPMDLSDMPAARASVAADPPAPGKEIGGLVRRCLAPTWTALPSEPHSELPGSIPGASLLFRVSFLYWS